MDTAPQAAPTDRGRLSSLLRLWPFARPYRGLIVLTFGAALLATLAQLAVPLLTVAVVDGPIASDDRWALVPLLALALAFGVAEAALFFLRRWAMNRSSLRIERDLRNVLYQRLQRLPVAFHDRWGSGQLLSRATTDVSTIRRFVGFAAVFLAVNLITCVVVLVLLLITYWPLGLAVLLTTVPLTLLGARWERRYNVQSRLVQDQQGELTTDIEEAVQGIRVIKSLGGSGLVFDRYDAAVHGRDRRPGAGHGRRPDRGGRLSVGAGRGHRPVRRPAPRLGRQPRLRRPVLPTRRNFGATRAVATAVRTGALLSTRVRRLTPRWNTQADGVVEPV